MKKISLLTSLLILLVSCSSPQVTPGDTLLPSTPTPELQAIQVDWWRNAVFYEIFVRSFSDSDGDGIGDFNGLTEKLDYLNDGDPATTADLGITAIWLMPINPSPSYHGYDVVNYYNVNPQYGTLDDFRRFLDAAHQRGIHVIMDLVINHTSSSHPFFQSAQDPDSPFRNWYIWGDGQPPMAGAFGGSAWREAPSGLYYGYFGEGMPDLNFANPEVTAQVFNVVRFWLQDVGVDGFRLDAAKHLFEADGRQENVPATHAWLQGFYTNYKTIDPQTYVVGEVYGAGAFMAGTYTGDQLDQVFNFEMASGFVNSAAGMAASGINSAITFALADMPDGNYATFLTNHDQERVMSVLNGDIGKAKIASFLLLTSPGTPYIYYGEEIGMPGEKPDETIRTPMQWTFAENAGFTSGVPWEEINPGYEECNVASLTTNPDSLLSHYRALIRLRASHPALRTGAISIIQTGNPHLYAALRALPDENLVVIANLSNAPISDYSLVLISSALPAGSFSANPIFGAASVSQITVTDGGGFSNFQPLAPIPAFTTLVLSLSPN